MDAISGTVKVNGANLSYEVAGDGYPLVLVHAGIADRRMWDEQFELFAQHYRVVRYDMRGFGESDLPAGPFAMRDDLYALLRALEIKCAHLLGLSMGGSTVLECALEHPEVASALVLVASGVGGFDRWSDRTKAYWEAEEAAEKRGDFDDVIELNLRFWVDGPDQRPDRVAAALRERVRVMYETSVRRPWADATAKRLDPPAMQRLGEIDVPTLVIAGDLDTPEMMESAGILEANIAGARKVVIPGVAHMVNMERPEAFSRLVVDFLATCPAE